VLSQRHCETTVFLLAKLSRIEIQVFLQKLKRLHTKVVAAKVAAKERERKRKKFWTLTRHDECQFCPQLA
jgi:hypothetical protein